MLDMMSGRISILSMRMSTSPGKLMNMMISLLGFPARAAKPITPPMSTPRIVSTSNRFFRHQRRHYNNECQSCHTVRKCMIRAGKTNYKIFYTHMKLSECNNRDYKIMFSIDFMECQSIKLGEPVFLDIAQIHVVGHDQLYNRAQIQLTVIKFTFSTIS